MKLSACRHIAKRQFALIAVIGVVVLLGAFGRAAAAWRQGPDQITVGDGHGGTIAYRAYKQEISAPTGFVRPLGLAQMDNGEVAMAAYRNDGSGDYPVITFSGDAGNSWSPFQVLPSSAATRPLALTYLGGGKLSYISGSKRYFSNDYGRTWPESVVCQSLYGHSPGMEGNDWVEVDNAGNTVVMELDYYWKYGEMVGWPERDSVDNVFRRSLDGGRTWLGPAQGGDVLPPTWKFDVTYNGQVYHRGVNEGSVARAANGWLVAAVRTDMPPRFIPTRYDDLEGMGVSISKDDGKTWSEVKVLYEAGRHHVDLHRLPNDDLVMTFVCLDDIRSGGGLDSNMRGADALISEDNGETWDLARRITVDAFEYLNPNMWYDTGAAHLGSTVLSDGWMLTAYGKYTTGTIMLTKWDPTALHCPEPSCWSMLVVVLLGAWAYVWRKRKGS
jgi:hypothetical protein